MQTDRVRRGGAVMSREYTDEQKASPYFKYLVEKDNDEDRAAMDTANDSVADVAELKARATPPSNVVSMAGAAAKRAATKPAPKLKTDDKDPNHVKVGTVTLNVIRDRGDDVLFSDKAAYLYSDGLWKMAADGATRWLNVEIERTAKKLNYPSTIKLINETREWIRRHEKQSQGRDPVGLPRHGADQDRAGKSPNRPDQTDARRRLLHLADRG